MTNTAASAVAGLLTDDLILEILSRLPARSIQRFKCVSRQWRDLIAEPAHRNKLPQPLAGFLYTVYSNFYSSHRAFVGVSAPFDPALPFLQSSRKYRSIVDVDTCNGLLLCRCYIHPTGGEFRYVVCNPATERWVELPQRPHAREGSSFTTPRLAFDPAAPSRFHVLDFEETKDVDKCITGLIIYSSQSGAWSRRDSGLVERITLASGFRSAFAGGMLHLLGRTHPRTARDYLLVAVDMEGKAWKTIRTPPSMSFESLGLSQGRVHYATSAKYLANPNMVVIPEIALWCLENHDDTQEWVLKHRLSADELLEIITDEHMYKYHVAAIHPDCDAIFLDFRTTDKLASYHMRHRKFHLVLNLEESRSTMYLPYVPFFSDSFGDAPNCLPENLC